MDEALNPNVGATAEAGASESQPNASAAQPATIEGEAAKLLELLEGRFTERFSTLEKNLTGQLSGLKKVQGEIDRSREDFRNQLTQLNKLTKQGMTQEEALQKMEQDAAESDRFTKLEQQIANLTSLLAGNQNGQAQQSVASVFAKYGLDVKDPRVAPALTKQYTNLDEAEVAALKLFHAIQTSPTPTPAQQPSLTGGVGRRDVKDLSPINDSSTLYDIAAKEIFGG
jgi:hypothetical protein